MQTIETNFYASTEVKRSKFLTHLVPISQYKGLQDKLKKEHPKANHVVYALRYLNEFNQVVENSSDDGEPKGSAGTPALNVLRGKELINCAVLVVRYFGGIKLGVGGMARAYTLAVKDVLDKAKLIEYEESETHIFSSSYSQIDKILYRLKKIGIVDIERDFNTTDVSWKIIASQKKILDFKED